MIEMDMSEKERLARKLDQLPLGGWHYYVEIGSTNDAALQWASEGAPDWSVVVADKQTKGRGRGERQWITRPGAALALSLILRPAEIEKKFITRFTALGALGVVYALEAIGLQPEIKWPNDVLLVGRKVAGILVDGEWQGENPLTLVVGIGVNIKNEAVPEVKDVRYPATSVETIYGKPVERWGILADVIRSIQKLRSLLISDAFIEAWNQHLAFRDEWILFKFSGKSVEPMKVQGVSGEGKLTMIRRGGQKIEAVAGEIVTNNKD